MRKILPVVLFIFIVFAFLLPQANFVYAQIKNQPQQQQQSSDGSWVNDSEVTFVGKSAARSGEFLDWTLQNYDWMQIAQSGQFKGINPLISFWATIRNIVYAFLILAVLATAFILIITRGQNISARKVIPKFVMVVILVTFSFSLIQFLYQTFDAVQGFFLRNPDPNTFKNFPYISQRNLLNIAFDYKNFTGYRIVGSQYEESAFISLLLVKLTAITYYFMTGVLLLRKIILWFFVIISPVFPLLLLFYPLRNTAKIWIGEFFRWLLYAPLFSIFLSGLVAIWRMYIPLQGFDTFKGVGNVGNVVYPTAVNILLGGPGQVLSINNSVNMTSTFAQYVVALLMLWVVILLPFLLLQIFLDYFMALSLNDNSIVKQISSSYSSIFNKPGSPPPAPVPPGMQHPAGMAKPLPFTAKIEIPEIRQQPVRVTTNVNVGDILRLTNLSVPTMRDIAKYETNLMSSDRSRRQEVTRMNETLSKIANPRTVGTFDEQKRYSQIREKLVAEKEKGDPLATSILTAAVASAPQATETQISAKETARVHEILKEIVNPDISSSPQKVASLRDQLVDERQKGSTLASVILTAATLISQKGSDPEAAKRIKEQLKDEKKKGNKLADSILSEAESLPEDKLQKEIIAPPADIFEKAEFRKSLQTATTASFPVVNRVQSVNLEDYENIKKIWKENYEKMEAPRDPSGLPIERKEWIKRDSDKISQTIDLLVSPDPEKVKEGTKMVSNILPFLLIGGFSKTEVVTYLKAKLEAAKSILEEGKQKEEEEETLLDLDQKKEQKAKEMAFEAATEVQDSGEAKLSNEQKAEGKEIKGND